MSPTRKSREVLPGPLYRHSLRWRADVRPDPPLNLSQLEAHLRRRWPRGTLRKLQGRRASKRPGQLLLIIPGRDARDRPRPPYDLVDVDLPGFQRVRFHVEAQTGPRLSVSIDCKAPGSDPTAILTAWLRDLTGVDVQLTKVRYHSVEVFCLVPAAALDHARLAGALLPPDGYPGSAPHVCGTLHTSWLGIGTGAARTVWFTLRAYSYSEDRFRKLEVRVGPSASASKRLKLAGYERAATRILSSVLLAARLPSLPLPADLDHWIGHLISPTPNRYRARRQQQLCELLIAWDADSPVPMLHRRMDLKHELGFAGSTLTALLNRLESRDLIEQHQVPRKGGGRKVLVRLTDTGRLQAAALGGLRVNQKDRPRPVTIIGPFHSSSKSSREQAGKSDAAAVPTRQPIGKTAGAVHVHFERWGPATVTAEVFDHPIERHIVDAVIGLRRDGHCVLLPAHESERPHTRNEVAAILNRHRVPTRNGQPWSARAVGAYAVRGVQSGSAGEAQTRAEAPDDRPSSDRRFKPPPLPPPETQEGMPRTATLPPVPRVM